MLCIIISQQCWLLEVETEGGKKATSAGCANTHCVENGPVDNVFLLTTIVKTSADEKATKTPHKYAGRERTKQRSQH